MLERIIPDRVTVQVQFELPTEMIQTLHVNGMIQGGLITAVVLLLAWAFTRRGRQ